MSQSLVSHECSEETEIVKIEKYFSEWSDRDNFFFFFFLHNFPDAIFRLLLADISNVFHGDIDFDVSHFLQHYDSTRPLSHCQPSYDHILYHLHEAPPPGAHPHHHWQAFQHQGVRHTDLKEPPKEEKTYLKVTFWIST